MSTHPTHAPASADTLLPPRRVGRTLAHARVAAGLTPTQAGLALEGRLDEVGILALEEGVRPVDEADLAALAELYGLELSTTLPERGRLVVDLEEGLLDAGGHRSRLPGAAARTDVLERYLALVYAMRRVDPGTTVDLRDDDLDVLAGVFAPVRRADLERELHVLMVGASAPMRRRLRELTGRLLLPVAGIVVAATAAGTLLLVPADDSAAEPVATAPAAAVVEQPADAVPVQIGTAVVQERLGDGSAGPVTVRD